MIPIKEHDLRTEHTAIFILFYTFNFFKFSSDTIIVFHTYYAITGGREEAAVFRLVWPHLLLAFRVVFICFALCFHLFRAFIKARVTVSKKGHLVPQSSCLHSHEHTQIELIIPSHETLKQFSCHIIHKQVLEVSHLLYGDLNT